MAVKAASLLGNVIVSVNNFKLKCLITGPDPGKMRFRWPIKAAVF